LSLIDRSDYPTEVMFVAYLAVNDSMSNPSNLL
jgi:hypothetical protein